jgi:DNA-binding transcriptional LysR family regulator
MGDERSTARSGAAANWSDFTLRQLAHFVAVAEAGSLSGAAERLYMSPSAVAASLDELERSLDADLCVRRRAQGITLTPVGRVVFQGAKALLDEASELSHLARGAGAELVGPLVVGCFVTLAPTVLPPLLEMFEAEHPRVTVDFVEGDQVGLQEKLVGGELDVAVMYDLDVTADLSSIVLYEPSAYALFAADHPLAGEEFVTLEQLVGEPLALFDQPPSARYAMNLFRDVGLSPLVRHRTQTLELTRSLVARGLAYAILVQRPWNKSSYEGRSIVEKEIRPPVAPCPVILAWPRDATLSPRAQALAQLARAQYAAGPVTP